MVDLLPSFNETKQAFENGDRFSLLIYYCLFIGTVVFEWKYIRLPYVKPKFVIWSIFGFFTIALWSIGLLNGLVLYLLIVLFLILAPVLYYSSCGNLLWPCSLIDRKVSNFLMANEPEKAEQMLCYYRWCSLGFTGKYSYYLRKAATAAAKGNMCSSIEILSKIDTTKLNKDENIRLELCKANYFSQLGDFNRAKQTVEHLSNMSGDLGEYWLQVYLIQALSAEFEGNLQKSSELLKNAINTCTDDTDVYYQVALNNMGRIRRFEKNYTDSFYYYQKSLQAVQNSRNRTSIHISYQNVIESLVLGHKSDEEVEFIQEYQSFIDSKNLSDLVEYYNFLIEYYRQKGDKYNLSKTLEKSNEKTYSIMSRKEQLISDIYQLRIRWNGGLLYSAVLDKIEAQYIEYSKFSQVEKFNCYIEIHHVLQALSDAGLLGTHIDMYNTNRENIGILIPELKKYLYTIPEYCVSEKCKTMWNIVRAAKCNSDYDKDEVLRVLKDIKDTYSNHGNFIEAFNIGLDICDEALFQKKYKEMWKFTKLAIDEIKRLPGHSIVTPAFIRIACYAYNAGELDISRDYVELYEETDINISHYAYWIQSYYDGIKSELCKVA